MGTPRLQVPVVIVICYFAWLFAVRLSSDTCVSVLRLHSFIHVSDIGTYYKNNVIVYLYFSFAKVC